MRLEAAGEVNGGLFETASWVTFPQPETGAVRAECDFDTGRTEALVGSVPQLWRAGATRPWLSRSRGQSGLGSSLGLADDKKGRGQDDHRHLRRHESADPEKHGPLVQQSVSRRAGRRCDSAGSSTQTRE